MTTDQTDAARERLRAMALSLATSSGPLVEPRAFDAAIGAYRDAVLAAAPAPVQPPVRADEADVDAVADRAAKVITSMGADIRALTKQRDRYRTAWRSALERAVRLRTALRRMADEAQPATEARQTAAPDSGNCTTPPCRQPANCRYGCRAAVDELTRLGQEMEQPAAEACPQCGDSGACAGGPCPLLPASMQLPFIHTDNDGDQLNIGALMASTYDGEAPVVAVCAMELGGDDQATVYVRPEAVELVVTALRAARHAAEEMAKAQQDGAQA